MIKKKFLSNMSNTLALAFVLLTFPFDMAKCMLSEEKIDKESTRPTVKDGFGKLCEEKLEERSLNEKFGHGNSMSELRKVSQPSIPSRVDNHKTVFSSISPDILKNLNLHKSFNGSFNSLYIDSRGD